MDDDILLFLEKEQQKSSRITQNFLNQKRAENDTLGIPMKVMLKELAAYTLRGGKWHRPALVRLGIAITNRKSTPSMMRASIATEMMHRYLLIHDDIIDQDLIRHGGPTLQKIYQDRYKDKFRSQTDVTYSTGMAMIAGDILNALTQQLIFESGLEAATTLRLIYGINQEMIDTASGWILETDLKNMPLQQVSLAQITQAMTLVSANYSVLWPLRFGQILAGRAWGDWNQEIEIYGLEVGLAFQIQDDILGVFGDSAKTGKPVGGDISEGKKTLLTQWAYDHASPNDRARLQGTLNHPISEPQLTETRRIMVETGALNYAQTETTKHCQKGIGAIKRLKTNDEEARHRLIRLAEFLAHRNR